jgi:TrmH family RNA methyltransferase
MILSTNNSLIKRYAKLKDKKYREEEKLFIVETYNLVEEAFKVGLLKEVFVLADGVFSFDVPVTVVSSDVMKKLSTTSSIPNIIGIVKKQDKRVIVGDKILLLDKIQDPGNLGTIIRSSVAFNIDTIVLSPDTVDLYNPKVIRSTEGMLFHTNIVQASLQETIEELKDKNYKIYGTDVIDGTSIKELTNEDKSKFALVVGNEGNGVSKNLYDSFDDILHIEMNDKVESLNVSVATSILLYEMDNKNE